MQAPALITLFYQGPQRMSDDPGCLGRRLWSHPASPPNQPFRDGPSTRRSDDWRPICAHKGSGRRASRSRIGQASEGSACKLASTGNDHGRRVAGFPSLARRRTCSLLVISPAAHHSKRSGRFGLNEWADGEFRRAEPGKMSATPPSTARNHLPPRKHHKLGKRNRCKAMLDAKAQRHAQHLERLRVVWRQGIVPGSPPPGACAA
jgi:hypothetical protein